MATRRPRARSDKERRDKPVNVAFTKVEYDKIEAARGAESRGAFVGRAAMESIENPDDRGLRLIVDQKLQEMLAVRAALGKVGANVNQIARAMNEGRQPANSAVTSVFSRLDALITKIDDGVDDLIGRRK